MEHSRVLSLANEATDVEQKGVYLAEAARWSWPIGSERPDHLNQALELSLSIQSENPDGARAIAEEVRASLYVVRTGAPEHPEIMARANAIIVEELVRKDKLDDKARATPQTQYEKTIGPNPNASLMSSLGFVLWLIGLGMVIWTEQKKRQWGALMSLAGLACYLGFLPLA